MSDMDLKTYPFPTLSDLDIVTSTQQTDPALLAEARSRGFYNGYTPYNNLFYTLFFSGGQLHLKQDLPHDFKVRALRYLKALMRSSQPKHEEKEAICAMLLSELTEAPDAT